MRIRHIAVRNLFGMFDHDIPLNGGDRITIVYGPNGYGKTFTLTLVDELFNPGFEDFYRIPFSELAVGFDDGSTIGLTKEERNDGETLTFTLTPAAGRKKTFTCGGRPCRGGDEPAWFRSLRDSVHIRFVHTDRLVRFQRSGKSHNGLAVHDMADSLTASVRKGSGNELQERISLLTGIVNSRFNLKRMEVTKERGMELFTAQGKALPPEALSSGEQHILMLLYELLFHVKPDSLILVDEPELSLHIVWQQEFIRDIERIIALCNFDVLIATHSPQIIHDRWDLAVELKGPSA